MERDGKICRRAEEVNGKPPGIRGITFGHGARGGPGLHTRARGPGAFFKRRGLSSVTCSASEPSAYSLPVWLWGASTGLDSGEPRCLSQIERTTIAARARNSLCQFWKDSNQKREVAM